MTRLKTPKNGEREKIIQWLYQVSLANIQTMIPLLNLEI